MYNLKLITLAGLLLASQAIASRISYTAYNKSGGVNKSGNWETKAGGRIPDERDEEVTTDIGEWSNGRFSAAQNTRTGIIIVKALVDADDKTGATNLNNEAQQLVLQHVGQQG